MKTKAILILLTAMIFTVKLSAQNTPQPIIDKFFKNYEQKGTAVAIDELYATNPWTSRIQDAINNVKTQLGRFDKDLVGNYYGYEFVNKEPLGQSYVLYTYFMKFDREFLRLTFQFYKPKDEWRLASFKFDDSFGDDLEEAAKVYNGY